MWYSTVPTAAVWLAGVLSLEESVEEDPDGHLLQNITAT